MTGTTSSPRSTGAKRRRPLLLTVVAAGAVVGLLGVAGVFATSSDRATTGQNDARSGDLAQPEPSVHLQLATATGTGYAGGQVTCNDDWSDDLTTGIITSDGVGLTGALPDDTGYMCIRNVGTLPANYVVRALDVVDSELTCAPDEAAVDATCGGSGAGELSGSMITSFRHTNDRISLGCVYETREWPLHRLATDLATGIGWLVPGEVHRVCTQVSWPADPGSQTDRVSWRYAFDAEEHACGNDSREPNDDDALASPLTLATAPVTGMVCPGDRDVYRVTTGAQSLRATLSWSADLTRDELRLVLRSVTTGEQLFLDAGAQSARVTVPANGTYLVEARPATAVGETAYTLALEAL